MVLKFGALEDWINKNIEIGCRVLTDTYFGGLLKSFGRRAFLLFVHEITGAWWCICSPPLIGADDITGAW